MTNRRQLRAIAPQFVLLERSCVSKKHWFMTKIRARNRLTTKKLSLYLPTSPHRRRAINIALPTMPTPGDRPTQNSQADFNCSILNG